jgi:hypothetical protein
MKDVAERNGVGRITHIIDWCSWTSLSVGIADNLAITQTKRVGAKTLLAEENQRLRDAIAKAKTECDASLEMEIKRTAAANEERKEVMAFIVPIITSERLNLLPKEQAEFQRILRGISK